MEAGDPVTIYTSGAPPAPTTPPYSVATTVSKGHIATRAYHPIVEFVVRE